MKVSKERNAGNRAALVVAAERLFKEKGFDGVGVADISKAAGLTHGGFYAHFESKAALAAEACKASQNKSAEALLHREDQADDTLGAYLDFYLSNDHRDSVADGCPMSAYITEVRRQALQLQTNFVDGFKRTIGIVEAALLADMPPQEARRRALTIVTGMVGAVAMARASAETSPDLADEILKSVRKQLRTFADAPSTDFRISHSS